MCIRILEYLRRCRPGLGLAIANDACYNEVRLIHDRAKRDRQGITELTTLMDGSRCLRVDMAGTTSAARLKEIQSMTNLGGPPVTENLVIKL